MDAPNAESGAAERLYEAGRRRARERAALVEEMRHTNTHPLVMAVLERWGVMPHEAQPPLWDMARSAVWAVLNCTDGGEHEAVGEDR